MVCLTPHSPIFHDFDRSIDWLIVLHSTNRELAELHKANATKDSVAQELALSHQVQAKEELEQALERATEEARMQQEALANQVA